MTSPTTLRPRLDRRNHPGSSSTVIVQIVLLPDIGDGRVCDRTGAEGKHGERDVTHGEERERQGDQSPGAGPCRRMEVDPHQNGGCCDQAKEGVSHGLDAACRKQEIEHAQERNHCEKGHPGRWGDRSCEAGREAATHCVTYNGRASRPMDSAAGARAVDYGRPSQTVNGTIW